jgi:adenylate cyclase class 2
MTEIEVKIRIADPAALREKLLALKAVITRERHAETNVLYDLATAELRSRRQALRLRTAGKRATLTYKGEEFETQVRNPKELRKILKALGLKETFAYAKHRTVLRKGRLTIAIDETSVGNFIELEGERHEITRLARVLGYGRADFIKSDYVELILQAGEKSAPV